MEKYSVVIFQRIENARNRSDLPQRATLSMRLELPFVPYPQLGILHFDSDFKIHEVYWNTELGRFECYLEEWQLSDSDPLISDIIPEQESQGWTVDFSYPTQDQNP